MTLPVRDAARVLGVPVSELRHWIHAGAPVARHGGRGRGNLTLVDPDAINAWRTAAANEQLAFMLAAELPQVLAEALSESHTLATGVAKAPLAGVLVGTWYVAATKLVDALRAQNPAIPEITEIPPAIERLRAISRR